MKKLPEDTEFEWAIGVLVTLELGDKKYALLQKRPERKPDWSPESFPGCLQVSVHGKLEKNNKRESFVDGLTREIREETIEMLGRINTPLTLEERMALGIFISANATTSPDVLKFYQSLTPDSFGQQRGILTSSREFQADKKKKKTDITTWFHIWESVLKWNPGLTWVINKLRSSDVIALLSVDDLHRLVPLVPKLHKKYGITEIGKYGMFQDEIDAVTKALSE